MAVDRELEAAYAAILYDRPIAYRPVLARVAGSVTAGIMLAQAIYWTPRATDPDGWWYKTQAEWQEETALTRSEWINARKALRSRELLEERLRGVPATLHYRVCYERLTALLAGQHQQAPSPDRRKGTSGSQPHGELDRRKDANIPLSAESTTESDDPIGPLPVPLRHRSLKRAASTRVNGRYFILVSRKRQFSIGNVNYRVEVVGSSGPGASVSAIANPG